MKELIDLYKLESDIAFKSISSASIVDFVNLIIKAYKNENKVFACGNGGNVASVQNLVLDLNMHPFVSEDKEQVFFEKVVDVVTDILEGVFKGK